MLSRSYLYVSKIMKMCFKFILWEILKFTLFWSSCNSHQKNLLHKAYIKDNVEKKYKWIKGNINVFTYQKMFGLFNLRINQITLSLKIIFIKFSIQILLNQITVSPSRALVLNSSFSLRCVARNNYSRTWIHVFLIMKKSLANHLVLTKILQFYILIRT